jgi:LCP family protein required for cell wall assembly
MTASAVLAAAATALTAHWLLARPYSDEAFFSPLRLDEATRQEHARYSQVPGSKDANLGVSAGRERAARSLGPAGPEHAGQRPNLVPVAAQPDLPSPITPAVAVPERTPPFENTDNYLLVGLDRRPDTRYGGLADTIIVAVFDRVTGHVGLVSVPRDLYVEIPGHGPDRVNAVMALAYRLNERPLALLARVIENTLALPVKHSLAIDLEVFEKAVDVLGGVHVDVPCPIIDDFIDQREPSGRRVLSVEAGTQLMDGVTAAMYVRSRHGRTDWSRARRQQSVLLGMRERFLSLGAVLDLPELYGTFEKSLVTDMRRVQLLRLAERVSRVDSTRIHGLVLGHRQTDAFRTEDNRAVLLPNHEAIDEALRGLFKAPPPGTPPAGHVCPPADAALRRGVHHQPDGEKQLELE